MEFDRKLKTFTVIDIYTGGMHTPETGLCTNPGVNLARQTLTAM
jgi:hypothetical protein